MLAIFQASCVEFIIQNEELLHTKTFQELSEELQNELKELASWDQRTIGIGGDRPPPPGMWDLSDMTARMRLRTDVSEEGIGRFAAVFKSHIFTRTGLRVGEKGKKFYRQITSCSSTRKVKRSRLSH